MLLLILEIINIFLLHFVLKIKILLIGYQYNRIYRPIYGPDFEIQRQESKFGLPNQYSSGGT